MKVHFAGMEIPDHSIVLTKIAGIHYGLFTVFPFICKEFGIQPIMRKAEGQWVVDFNQEHFKGGNILDSGIFTLAFGAHAGKRDKAFIDRWQDAIVAFVEKTGYSQTVVEVDCQKVVSVDYAWTLRQRLKEQLPNHRQVNVYHMEDGKVGLDRLIEFSDYIAISVPELRKAGIPKLPQYVQRQAAYIKNKKPEIDIHLLGCTTESIMKLCKFCTSCDSTSWQQVVRYGYGNIGKIDGKRLIVPKKQVDRNADEYARLVTENLNRYFPDSISKDPYYLAAVAISSIYLKRQYTESAGDQNL